MLPSIIVLCVVALWRLPMRFFAHGLLFVALLFDNSTERPGRGLYQSFLYVPGTFLYEALSKTAHIPGFKLTGLECLILLLSTVHILRTKQLPVATPALRSAYVAMGMLLLLWVYGMARGGNIQFSFLQIRTMFFLPLTTLFFARTLTSKHDITTLFTTFTVVAWVRACMCIYYYLTVIRTSAHSLGNEGDGSYVTTHSDSLLATVAILICLIRLYEKPSKRALMLALLVIPIVTVGILLNNRRIAFVAIFLGFAFSYMAANQLFRKRVQRTFLRLLPFLLMYLAAGWGAAGSWAKPVRTLRSVLVQRDTSSATRDIENYNLLQTMRQNPIIGSGFGHQYIERIKGFSVQSIFEAYRYVPHNSMLWFLGVGGMIGFTLYWLFLACGVFMAARLCRYADNSEQAMLGMVALCAIVAYQIQSFGDMGLMSWMGSLLVASSYGLSVSLCVKIGAWHAPKPNVVTA